VGFDAIVSGVCFVDIVFGQVPRLPTLGEEVYAGSYTLTGGGYYTAAVALARLGLKVAILCPLGNDGLSQLLKNNLQSEGVCTDLIYEVDRPVCNVTAVMSQQEDRAFMTYVDHSCQAEFVEHAVRMLDTHDTRLLHLSALPHVDPMVRVARKRGAFVSMDIAWNDQWLRDRRLLDIIGGADLFIPNEREALAISQTSQVEEAIQKLHDRVPNVVVKLGARGSMYVLENQTHSVSIPTAVSIEVVDTTGAGDNFDAGVILGLLQGRGYTESCQIGNYCGGESLRGLGGTTASPRLEQVNQFLFETYGWQLFENIHEGVN
jgi:sugar/nucleoside kinase (ribokinase family)